jgi:hypothetical protein
MTQSLSQQSNFAVEALRHRLPSHQRSRALSSIENVHNVVAVFSVDCLEKRRVVASRAIFSRQGAKRCRPPSATANCSTRGVAAVVSIFRAGGSVRRVDTWRPGSTRKVHISLEYFGGFHSTSSRERAAKPKLSRVDAKVPRMTPNLINFFNNFPPNFRRFSDFPHRNEHKIFFCRNFHFHPRPSPPLIALINRQKCPSRTGPPQMPVKIFNSTKKNVEEEKNSRRQEKMAATKANNENHSLGTEFHCQPSDFH